MRLLGAGSGLNVLHLLFSVQLDISPIGCTCSRFVNGCSFRASAPQGNSKLFFKPEGSHDLVVANAPCGRPLAEQLLLVDLLFSPISPTKLSARSAVPDVGS